MIQTLYFRTTSSDSDTQSCQLSKASMTKSNLWDNWTELCTGASSFWAKRQHSMIHIENNVRSPPISLQLYLFLYSKLSSAAYFYVLTLKFSPSVILHQSASTNMAFLSFSSYIPWSRSHMSVQIYAYKCVGKTWFFPIMILEKFSHSTGG